MYLHPSDLLLHTAGQLKEGYLQDSENNPLFELESGTMTGPLLDCRLVHNFFF